MTGLTALGSTYRFKVRAVNNAGFAESTSVLNAVLASVPDASLLGPDSDASVTNETCIKATYGPQDASTNGGSPLLSYELQFDNGKGGNFTSLVGFDSPSLETTFTVCNLTFAGVYRFRFRTQNINGWSAFSPVNHIRAATIP